MLIATIRTVERIDYPNFELVVVDNNTEDEETWRPVEEYCRDRPRLRFVHVSPLEGYKSGALNLALREHTHPQAEIVGVIDADYQVDPDYLRATVGYFADTRVAFVQTPQDYREYEGSPYFTACYDAYRYFFATAMPSRNERDSIIFAGTMGLFAQGPAEAGRGLGRVVHYRGCRHVAAPAQGRLLGDVRGSQLRARRHAVDVCVAKEPALSLVLWRHADSAPALEISYAVGPFPGQPAFIQPEDGLPLRRFAVDE
jgi:glycosyltransferase involved in cell wall biosynthesis